MDSLPKHIEPASGRFNFEGILKYLIVGAVACLALGVFASTALSAGYHILLLMPGMVCLVRAFRREGWGTLPKSSLALLALIGMGVICCVANWNSMHYPLRSLLKLKYFLFGILGLVALRHVICQGISRKIVRGLLHLFFASIIISVIYGITGTFADFDLETWEKKQFHREGGLTGTMRFGYGIGMVLPILLALWLRREKWADWFDARLLTVTLIMGLVGLLLTQTRGAMLGMLCAVPLTLLLHNRERGLIIGCFFGLLVTLLILGNVIGNERLERMFSVKMPGRYMRGFASDDRLSIYTAAVMSMSERPLQGVGMNQFRYHINDLKARYDLDYPDVGASHAHNVFLEIGADLGILGLVALVVWCFLWGLELWRRYDAVGVCLLPFLVAFVVSGQFEYLFDANNSFLIFFLYSLSSSTGQLSKVCRGKGEYLQLVNDIEVRH